MDPESCIWRFQASTLPDEYGSVWARNGGSTSDDFRDPNSNTVDFAGLDVVDFDEEVDVYDFDGKAVSGHPSLSDGVVVYGNGWGDYVFWVPPSDEYVSLHMVFNREEDRADNQARFFGFADRFVQELGWLG